MSKFDDLFKAKYKIYEATTPTTDPFNKAKKSIDNMPTGQTTNPNPNPMSAKSPMGQPTPDTGTGGGQQGAVPVAGAPVQGQVNNQAQAQAQPQGQAQATPAIQAQAGQIASITGQNINQILASLKDAINKDPKVKAAVMAASQTTTPQQ